MTAFEIGLMAVGGALALYALGSLGTWLALKPVKLSPELKKRRRQELLLTFSPGEWLWMTLYLALFAALLLWTLR